MVLRSSKLALLLSDVLTDFFFFFQILGYSCVISVFFLQFLMLDLHTLDRTVPRLSCTEYTITLLYQITLIIALCGNVTVFRCLWILLENTFLTGTTS